MKIRIFCIAVIGLAMFNSILAQKTNQNQNQSAAARQFKDKEFITSNGQIITISPNGAITLPEVSRSSTAQTVKLVNYGYNLFYKPEDAAGDNAKSNGVIELKEKDFVPISFEGAADKTKLSKKPITVVVAAKSSNNLFQIRRDFVFTPGENKINVKTTLILFTNQKIRAFVEDHRCQPRCGPPPPPPSWEILNLDKPRLERSFDVAFNF